MDISILPLEDERDPWAFLSTPFDEIQAMFSPDGQWIAYVSNETGRYEVYVRPFPGPGGKWQISTVGGNEPRWEPNGRELFYRDGDKMMAVEISMEPEFTASAPHLLFEGPYTRSGTRPGAPRYDITPDGQRFLMIKPSEQESSPVQLNIVLNWFEELKRLVPTENN